MTITEAHLSKHGVTMQQAKTFILSNLSNLRTIFDTCKLYGVNNDMIADILGGGYTGNDVGRYFDHNGFVGDELGYNFPGNYAPSSSNTTISALEDTARVLSLSDFLFADTNAGNILSKVKITALPVSGSLKLNGIAVALNQEIAASDIAEDLLVFTPALNSSGSKTFSFKVSDGMAYSETANTVTINVKATNDTPTSANITLTTNEDTAKVMKLSDFAFTDSDIGNTLAKIIITVLPKAGSLKLNGVEVTLNQQVLATDIAAGKLIFTSAANANAAGYASFGFKVSDGVAYSATANTVTFNVTAVNDAPDSSSTILTVFEDKAKILSLGDFAFIDPDTGSALSKIQITTLPLAGSLKLNGVAVILNQQILAADIAASKLIFTPAANANGEAYASFGFKVSDGTLYSQSADTVTINVTAVVDPLTLSGTTGNDTMVGDGLNDTLSGLAGDDVINGKAGADIMIGGAGNDTYYVDNVSDKVYETTTTTSTIDAGGSDRVNTTVGYVLPSFVETLYLSSTANINGIGNSLDNIIHAGSGNNVMDGKEGTDGLSYYYATSGVTISLASISLQSTRGSGSDLISNFENLYGSTHADILIGTAGINRISAGDGNDRIIGGGGADQLYGGGTTDSDTFVLSSPSSGVVKILDFNATNDKIELNNANYTKILNEGTMTKNDFANYIRYDALSGALNYTYVETVITGYGWYNWEYGPRYETYTRTFEIAVLGSTSTHPISISADNFVIV